MLDIHSIMPKKINRRNLALSGFSAVSLLVLHLFGMNFDLYYLFAFYDVLLHFLGGLTLGLFVGTMLGVRSKKGWITFTVVMALSLLWEVFEAYYGIAVLPEDIYWLDTTIDIILDTAGLLLAMHFIKNTSN